jgi:putative Mg2+ transporter-C (MgtC) family protein
MMCALLLSHQLFLDGRLSDQGLIASTVIQGIGFIAAGVIITTGREVYGLTTAAGVWVTTAIGLLIGAGFYVLAVTATIVTIVALIALRALEERFSKGSRPHDDANT